jgi:hypothetical protein
MNLTALLAELYRRCDYTSAPPTAITTRLTSHLNITHRQILGTPGLDTLRDDTITFASVANQAMYGLPPAIARIEAITDRTTMLRLRQRALLDIRASDPGLVQTGPSESFIVRGWQQVATQPAAATGLWAVSTSASDTQSCYIETVRTGGYARVGAAVALTGTTRVQLGTLTDHIEVDKFYVSTAAVGAISLYDAVNAGTELARIPIGGTYARYLGIQLYPTPASAITYYVDYLRTIADMVNGTDEPLLPDDFHWVLLEGALMKEWTKLDDARRTVSERDYTKGMSALKYFMNCPADFLPSRKDRVTERSRFGAWYPGTRV